MNLAFSNRVPWFLTLLFVVSFFLVACDSGGSNGDDNDSGTDVTGSNDDTFSIVDEGSFTATITKDGTSNTVSGGALFGEGEDDFTGTASFVIYMLSGQKDVEDGSASGDWTEIVIGDRNDTSAPTQTGADSFTDWSVSQVSPFLFSGGQDGTLTITSVSDTELKGEFELIIFGETTAEGTFTAKPTSNMAQVQCAPDCD